MLVFPEEYALSTAEDNEHGRRRLAVRRLWVWNAITSTTQAIGNVITSTTQAIGNAAQGGLNAMSDGWNWIKSTLNGLKSLADDIFSKIEQIGGLISKVLNLIRDWVTEVKAWLIEKLQALGHFAVDSIGTLWEAILNSLDGMLETVGLDSETQSNLINSLGATPWTAHTSGAVLRFCYPSLTSGAKKGASPLTDDTLNLNLGQIETAALRQQLDSHQLTSGESAGQKVIYVRGNFHSYTAAFLKLPNVYVRVISNFF